jgi:hypothetical protein
MPKLKPLSGDELLHIFSRFGFTKFSRLEVTSSCGVKSLVEVARL